MSNGNQTHDTVTQLSTELGDEILRRASSKEVAFHLINLAAFTIQVRVGFGIKAPEVRKRMVAEQNARLVELGIDPLQVYADRSPGGD